MRGTEVAKLEGRMSTAQKRVAGLEEDVRKIAAERAEVVYKCQQLEVCTRIACV